MNEGEREIKVLHLLNYPGNGGTERAILSLIEKLGGRGCSFSVACGMDGPMKGELAALGTPVYTLPMRSPFDFGAVRALRRLCAEQGIDIVHTHFMRENFIACLARNKKASFAIVNSVTMMTGKRGLTRIFNNAVTKKNSRVICASEAVRRVQASEGIPERKLEVVYPGAEYIPPEGADIERLRESLRLPKDAFVVASLARFRGEKGHDLALEAIRLFYGLYGEEAQSRVPVHFVLAGEGELLEEYRARVRNLGLGDSVHLPGHLPDTFALLGLSNLLISHSHEESFGLSIVEGLTAGLPVAASACDGPQEILGGQNCGLLTPKGDAKALAEAIHKLATDKPYYHELSRAAPLRAAAFTKEDNAHKTLEIYKYAVHERERVLHK